MNTYDYLKRRVSIRKFNDQPIQDEVMDKIIYSAKHAPTAGNMMMYSMIKIKDKETLLKLSESCDHQPFIAKADTAIIFVVDLYKWHRYFVINGVEEYAKRTDRTYDGPTFGDAILGINDAFCAAENAVIAAESFGVGSCYIGDIMENFEYHKELLNLPEFVFPAGMLVFGHFDHQPEPRGRFDDEFVVFDEQYHALTDDEIHNMYKERDAYFNANASEEIKNFAQQFYNRKVGSEFFKEMNRSLDVIFNMFKRP